MNEDSYLHDHLSHMYPYWRHLEHQRIINEYEAAVEEIFMQCEEKSAQRRAERAAEAEQSRRAIETYERNLKLNRQD